MYRRCSGLKLIGPEKLRHSFIKTDFFVLQMCHVKISVPSLNCRLPAWQQRGKVALKTASKPLLCGDTQANTFLQHFTLSHSVQWNTQFSNLSGMANLRNEFTQAKVFWHCPKKELTRTIPTTYHPTIGHVSNLTSS